MVLTEEQQLLIIQLLNTWYQNKYGIEWKQHFHKNMIPSPINEWIQTFNIKKKDISELRRALVLLYRIIIS